MPDLPDPSPIRRAVTPSERERVVEQLSAAFAHDLVTLDEFERRVALAYRADSPARLQELTADLAPAGGADMAGGGASRAVQRVGAVLGNLERGGTPAVPARLEVRAFMANVELDLTRARFLAPVTEIHVRCVMANVELRLPAGMDVENQGGGFLGNFECHHRGSAQPGAPIVRVIGRATFGNVEVWES